ncbi:hypothetical protein Nmel_002047 [Mimus melanotis]
MSHCSHLLLHSAPTAEALAASRGDPKGMMSSALPQECSAPCLAPLAPLWP